MNQTAPKTLFLVLLVTLVAPACAQTTTAPSLEITAALGTAPSFMTPEADANVTTLAVELESPSGPANLNVVVSHEDPTGETVVDRVVPVTVPQDETLPVGIQDLRSGVNYTVQAIDAAIPLPTQSDVTDLVDGNATSDLPGEAIVIAPAPSHAPRSNSAVAYRAADAPAGTHFQYRQLLALNSGLVTLFYVQQQGEAGQDIQDFVILARVSRDGGRTFGEAIPLTSHITHVSHIYFRAAGRLDGTVAVLWDWYIAGQPPQHGHGFTNFDPVNLSTSPPVAIGDLPGFYPGTAIVALPNGSVLVPIGYLYNLHTWMVDPEGGVHHVGVITNSEWPDGPAALAMDATPTGIIGIAFNVWEGSTTSVWYTRSLDGGLSFLAPQKIHADPNWYFQVSAASIDAAQTLHLAVRAFQIDSREHPSQYARIGIAGDVTVRSYADVAGLPADAPAYNPLLTAAGSRVWLMWYDHADLDDSSAWGIHLAESVDGGRSFAPAYHLILHYDGAAFPNSYGEQLEMERDGTPLIVSNAGGQPNSILIVPLFDSLADVESGLVQVGAAFSKAQFVPFATAQAVEPSNGEGNPTLPSSADHVTEHDSTSESTPTPVMGFAAAVAILFGLAIARRRRA